MSTSEADAAVTIERYFAAMRQGRSAQDEMMALFADDAVYTEPFSGVPVPAVGRAAILERLRQGWDTPLPDMELDVLAVDVRGTAATSDWECRSPALPGPVRGRDTYTFDDDGLIMRLDVEILDRPA